MISFLVVLILVTLENCKTPEKKEASVGPSLQYDSILSSDEQKRTQVANNIIEYSGVEDNEIKRAMETFSPLTVIQSLASRAIHIKDSLEVVQETFELKDPKDSLIFMPHVTKAYKAILEYKQLMASGPILEDDCPKLIQLTRTTKPGDHSINMLPLAGESSFLSHGNFFFLDGAPFLYKLRSEDNSVYTDHQGNPETRFGSLITENNRFLLNSIYHFKPGPINILFGPPLNSYESGPQEVNGIGSLIHTFVNRIPVFFITEKGITPAHLVAISVKLVPEYLGCVSDYPYIEFACSKNVEEKDILGVYISYNTAPITSCTVSRPSRDVWTADINNDGIADIASVSGTFEGAISDTMSEVLWLVNVEGTWRIIDWGQELDCT